MFYVEEKTGKRHYTKIAKLLGFGSGSVSFKVTHYLGFVGIDKNDKQLIRGVADAKRTLPQVVKWMKLSLSYIEQVSG